MEIFAFYDNRIFRCSFYIFCGFLLAISSTDELLIHTINQSDTVILECSSHINVENTWNFNHNSTINLNRIIWDERFKWNSFITANYSLLIQNVSIEQKGIYQCRNDSQILSTHFIKVEVIPILSFTINGINPIDQYVMVPRNETVIATCIASNARPTVNITWLVNNQELEFSSIGNQTISTYRNNNTYDTWSSLSFLPDGETGNITCVIDGLSATDLFVHGKFSVGRISVVEDQSTEYNKTMSSVEPPVNDSSSHVNLTIPFIIALSALIIVISFVVLIVCTRMKLKGSVTSQVPVNQNRTFAEPCNVTFDNERVSFHISKGRQGCADYSRGLANGLSINQEEISTHDPDYSLLSEDLNLQDTTTKSRNFNAKEMCLLLNLKMGPVYNKWMGTVVTDNDMTKSVVVSTIADQALRRKEVHWNEYVKRVLDLPRNKHLVSVVGICVNADSLYLLHEHVVGEPLYRSIHADKASGETLMTPSQALSHVNGILEGMELVHSYGFLHPGLTTKKILITDDGACKLYDFCLSKDAEKRVAVAKAQSLCNLNIFAPETLLRNAYTQACDIWSVGVVLWEIFSGGTNPFPVVEETIHSLDEFPSPPDKWPERYHKLMNRRVFDCWEEEVSLRPSLNQLRLSFSKIGNSLMSCDDGETVSVPEESTAIKNLDYVTMVGNT